STSPLQFGNYRPTCNPIHFPPKMHRPPSRLRRLPLRFPRRFLQVAGLITLFPTGYRLSAQDTTLTSDSSAPAPAPPSLLSGTSQLSSFTSPSDLLLSRTLFQWGPIRLRPHLTYRVTYGDGLQSQPGQQSKTLIQEVIPNFLFELGEKWTFSYTPAFRFYSDKNFKDSIDHSLSLNGRTTYQDWSFGLSQGYNRSSTPLVETGAQTDQESFSTHLSAGHQLSGKASLDLGVSQDIRLVGQTSQPLGQNLGDSREWSTMDWLNYQFTPKFSGGLGAGFGYVQIGTDDIYERVQSRINWKVGSKLNLGLTAGLEARQFLDSNQPGLLNPIFSASLQYQLFEATSLSLSASRSVNSSYFANQITENTSLDFSVSQRLFAKLFFTAGFGIGTTDYIGATAAASTGRKDDYTHYNFGLSMPFLKRGTASVFYSATDNSSGQSGFGYSSTQMGLELGYQF
ncbi:MAG: outer membrane beta-barrel protein, partial [Verrucomicrobiota bacterium]